MHADADLNPTPTDRKEYNLPIEVQSSSKKLAKDRKKKTHIGFLDGKNGRDTHVYCVPTLSHVLCVRMAFNGLAQSYEKDTIKLRILQMQPLMCSQSHSLQGEEMLT